MTAKNVATNDEWVIGARVAFYLAAVEYSASEAAFANAFDRAPSEMATSARRWVGELGIRQAYLLGPDSRTVVFMRGFAAYVEGQRAEAWKRSSD